VHAEVAMMCVVRFYSVFFAAAGAAHALQVSELDASALESVVHYRAPVKSAKAPLSIPGAFGNATDKEEDAYKNGSPLRGNQTHKAVARKGSSASNTTSSGTQYTISTPGSSFLFLKMTHTADDYHFFELAVFEVQKGWRPTEEQDHFLWYVTGPDEDGDVRLMNAKFKVMLTVKRKVRLLTTSTWVGACAESDTQCPAQWLLYGISNPDPEEADCLFLFHQSQHFMHHDSPAVTDSPYRTNLWRFDPPVGSDMVRNTLEARDW
jgi:hypothetical protein